MTATLDVPEDNLAASVFGDNAAESAMDAELNALDADIEGVDNILDSDLDNVAEVTDYGLDDLLDDSDMADDLTSLDVAENNIGNADLDLDGDADAIAGFDSTTLDDELAALDAVPAEGAEVTTIEDLQESFVEESDDLDLGEGTEVVDDLDFLDEGDEVATKLDLARAYIDMGDREGAQDILDEVLEEGNQDQQMQAKSLLEDL